MPMVNPRLRWREIRSQDRVRVVGWSKGEGWSLKGLGTRKGERQTFIVKSLKIALPNRGSLGYRHLIEQIIHKLFAASLAEPVSSKLLPELSGRGKCLAV